MTRRGAGRSNVRSSGARFAVGLLVLAGSFASVGCSGGESAEVKACKNNCPIEVVPVCASGKDYDNECFAKCAGETTIQVGTCTQPKLPEGGGDAGGGDD